MALIEMNGRLVRELKEANELAKKSIEQKDAEIKKGKKIQALLTQNILSLTEESKVNVGNDYPDYARAIQEISDKYVGKANWGVLQTGQIIDLRSAFILGEGVKVTHTTKTRKEAEKELVWAESFFKYNGLDAEMAQEIVKEAEIEGKLALSIIFDDAKTSDLEGGMISARFISWSKKKYEVVADPEDYLWFKELKWKDEAGKDVKKDEADFVYKKFGGRLNAPNEAQPKIQKCLTQIDRLDQALKDLRTINHLYAAQTPDFEVDNPDEVETLSENLQGGEGRQNWRIGTLIVHTGRFNLKGPDSAGVQNLIAEIELLLKMISGTTGIPIHFLGLLDLLRNRATGDNTRELVNASTTKERAIWKGAYQELIEKAMVKWNKETGNAKKSTGLDPKKIKVEIPLITQEHWDRIRDVLLPAEAQGVITKDTVAAQIPGIDTEAEAEKRAASDASELNRVKAELKKAQLEKAATGEFPGGEEEEGHVA